MLYFSQANAKTKRLNSVTALAKYLQGGRKVYSMDLSAGYTCPGAKECKSKAVVNPITGKATIKDGHDCQFRCFSATQEALFPTVRALHASNTEQIKNLKTVNEITNLILTSLPDKAGIIRLHVSGDFFKLIYMQAVVRAAQSRPDILFYFYTKSINYLEKVVKRLGTSRVDLSIGKILPNLLATASIGGKYDDLINKIGIRKAYVVFSELEASTLPIDHDDSHAATIGGSFALLLHGVQPKGSTAAAALSILDGKGSYSRV